MRNFLLIDSFLGEEVFFDYAPDFAAELCSRICGMAKIVRYRNDDSRAYEVIEICNVSREYTL